jgi:hypothetical protein
MTIKLHVDGAAVLLQNGLETPAFTLAMVTAAATARKINPEGTPSKIPGNKKTMGDKECFVEFLDSVISSALFGSPVVVSDADKETKLSEIIYKQYRCMLVHEASQPVPLSINSSPEKSFGFGFEGGTLKLDTGWIYLILEHVANHPENGPEFGIPHFMIKYPDGVSKQELVRSTMKIFGDDARYPFNLITKIIFHCNIDLSLIHDELELDRTVATTVKNHFNMGMVGAIKSDNILDDKLNLTEYGRLITLHLATQIKRVPYSRYFPKTS